MIWDLPLSLIWFVFSWLLVDASMIEPAFLASYKTAIQGLGGIIDAIEPLTIVIPFQAYGIALNFVIAVWVLYWPIRLVRWILEWARGKSGNA